MSHTALLDSVSAFLSALPAEMLAGAAPAVAIGEHLCSPLFREAPLRTRACALALEASEGGAVVSALAQLHAGIQQRTLAQAALEAEPSPQLCELARSFFLSAVLLHHDGLRRTSDDVVADVAEPSLHALSCIAIGAVALPQLAALEERFLRLVGQRGGLPAMLLGHLQPHLPGLPAATAANDARRALALRWAAASLAQPATAPLLWPVFPQLLDATLLPGSPGGALHVDACRQLVHASLSSLRVDVPRERSVALELLGWIHSRCAAAPHAPRSGAAGEHADAMCALLFSRMPPVSAPLLPQLLSSARELIVADAEAGGAGAQCERRCELLRAAVSACPIGDRKEELFAFVASLRSELPTLSSSGSL